MSSRIEAAGAVLVRDGAEGPEVAVVHRPHRSDWSLPKGKLEPGERHEVAAVREAFEETGVRCALGPSLGQRTYEVAGVPKRVRWWRATVLSESPREPDHEIDDIRWVAPAVARHLLTYDDDRDLVDRAVAVPATTATIVLRHAEAMKRAAWRDSGDPLSDLDQARPLDDHGMDQALALVDLLAAYAPRSVVSSDARRCRATVEPSAVSLGIEVAIDHALSEEGCADDPRETRATVRRLLAAGGPAVWCTHRPVLPVMLAEIASCLGLDRDLDALDPRLKPGAAVVVHRNADGSVVGVERLPA
ncbi:MAG TPA: NUDIX domain-containing protein [Candidatus Nanopelagicales bacterium]|nr:NUDIX domain-containing protein [Candidatus Nanopelagicales bacterium]